MSNFLTFCKELEEDIKKTYEEGVTMEEAEKLAGKFLHAMMQVTGQLKAMDLDARMKRAGTKAVKGAAYMEFATSGDKKPSDVLIGALVDQDKVVLSNQEMLDTAEVERDALQNYYNIFKESHVYFRGIAKGKFE